MTYIYNKASKHIWFAYFSLFDYLLKKDLATGPYLIILWSDLYSKGRQLSPLEGSCFQHLYIALRGRVPRCRRVFVGASPRCQGWHHMGRPMGPYVDVPTTGVEYVRFDPCKCWLVLKAGQTDLSFPPFLFAISIATLGRKGQTQTPPAWSAFFPPLFWFFSVSLPKKINLEDVSSFLGGDENPSNSRQLLPPDQALGRSEFCMQENQLHEETLGKALERAFPWWIWQQLRGKMAESNRIPLRCIGALVHWYVEQTIVLVEVKGCPVSSYVHHVHMQSHGKST